MIPQISIAAFSTVARPRPSFDLPLLNSLVPTRALGSATPTFTRATTATVADHEGVLRTTLAGEARFVGARRVRNLMTPGRTSPSVWRISSSTLTVATGVADPFGGTAAFTLTATGAVSYRADEMGDQSITNGITCINTAWLRRRTGTGAVKIHNGGSSGTTDITTSLTSSWKRFSAGVQTCSATTGYFGVQIDTSGDAVDWAFGQIEDITGQSAQVPGEYLDTATAYGAGVSGVCYFATTNGNTVASNVVTEAAGTAIPAATLLGYLAEGARTNLCLQSQFASGWGTDGTSTAAVNTAVAPNGTTTAVQIQATAANNDHYYAQSNLTFSAVPFTVSAYFLYVNNRWATISFHDGSAHGASFDLLNGVVGAVSAGLTSTIARVSATTYRCTVSFTPSATATGKIYLGLNATNYAGIETWNAAGTEILGAWGPQLELGAFASSYIPTTTTAVTRNADVLTYPSAGNINGTLGSCFAEITGVATTGSGTGFNAAGYVVNINSAGDAPVLYAYGGGVNKLAMYDGTNDPHDVAFTISGTPQKVASRWGGASMKTYTGGSAGSGGAFDGNFGAGTSFIVGARSASLYQLFGTVRNVRIYPIALPDSTLKAMTT